MYYVFTDLQSFKIYSARFDLSMSYLKDCLEDLAQLSSQNNVTRPWRNQGNNKADELAITDPELFCVVANALNKATIKQRIQKESQEP